MTTTARRDTALVLVCVMRVACQRPTIWVTRWLVAAMSDVRADDRVPAVAVIVDVDGTLCDVSSVRHLVVQRPKDFHGFHTAAANCPPHGFVLDEVARHHRAGRAILVVTARMYRWEESTRGWLDRHMPVPYLGPFMRGDGDVRRDVEVKRDIHRILTVDHGYRIVHCIDDNPAIVALWRELEIPTTVVPGWPVGIAG